MTDSSAKIQQSVKRPPPVEGKHDFIATHFQSATYCNFCHKKIWLKAAFQCQVCGMVCHKKCTERCQAQTICSKEGFQIKEPPSMVFHKNVKEKVGKEMKEEVKEQLIKDTAGHRTFFLSKFRKERGGSDQGAKALVSNTPDKNDRRPSTPEPVGIPLPAERKRHNSAPDEEHILDATESYRMAVKHDSLLSASCMTRTRSSTSIGELVKSQASPSVTRKNRMSQSSPEVSASEEEEEMNLLKVYEQQKAAHNADELVVTAAKEMGKELFAHLDFEDRKNKLDGMISKLQQEIDQESETRTELCHLEHETRDPNQKASYKVRIEKSDEKVQSLALLMLHYCAGLQHCMEERELDRQRRETESANDARVGSVSAKAKCTDEDQLMKRSSSDAGQKRTTISADDGEDDESAADDEMSYDESQGRESGMYTTAIREQTDSIMYANRYEGMQANTVTPRRGEGLKQSISDVEEDVSDALRSQQLVMSFQALLSQQDSDSEEDCVDDNQDGSQTSDPEQVSQDYDTLVSQCSQLNDSDQEMADEEDVESQENGDGSVIEKAGGVTIMVSEDKASESD